jgi:hypothetical protein
LTAPAERQPLIVRYGYPAQHGIEWLEPKTSESSISRTEFTELLKPLKHIQVPAAINSSRVETDLLPVQFRRSDCDG